MSLLSNIKHDAQRSGSNKGKFIFFREGEKKRVRFLNDMEDGLEITFHDSYEQGINVPCQETFGRTCSHCEEEGIRTRTQYAWSVWDYEAKEVKVFMFPVNNCSPVGAIVAMYETYGTLLDRDFVISVQGKQQNKQFSVVPMDKNKFRNEKAKPYSKSALLKILDKAFPDDESDDDDEYEDDEYEEKDKKSSKKKTKNNDDYSEMTPKQLYKLCEDRDIDAEPKKSAKYYISLLEDADADEAAEAEEDDWDDEEDKDYSDMSAKELYNLCKERDIEALHKKSTKYYINLLEEDDKAHDDWEEEEDEEDDWEDD